MTNPEHPSSLAHVQTARHLDRHLLKTPWASLSAWGVALVLSLGGQALAQGVEALEWQPGQSTVPLVISTPHNDVRKLLRQAKYAPALLVVNKNLETNPRDPQMRFWQAYIFEQLGQPEMALQIYLALTQEYPELAEPHNNLGVLYAIQGDYTKAKASFDAALRANPNYATAHENLGDVLLHLAQRSFQRAQKINTNSRSIQDKLKALQPALQLTLTTP